MIRRGVLVLALCAAAAPAVGQDDETPAIDARLIDDCLQRQSGEGGDPADCVGAAAEPCMDGPGGSSTAGMSLCLMQELSHWDSLLNAGYRQVMKEARASDADMAALGSAAEAQAPALQQMQRDWIAFRDSTCRYERSRWGGGTGAGPAGLQCLLDLTARQYLRLGAALQEGN